MHWQRQKLHGGETTCIILVRCILHHYTIPVLSLQQMETSAICEHWREVNKTRGDVLFNTSILG